MSAKKKATITKRASAPRTISPLMAELRGLILSARHSAASTINTLQVLTNFEIGRRIVEHEQQGAKRAAYGAELLKELSARLTEEFGRGFSPVNLSHMRRFFLIWKERVQIFQQPTENCDQRRFRKRLLRTWLLQRKASSLLTNCQFPRSLLGNHP